jgi:Holliday junction DNA helicase RuvA
MIGFLKGKVIYHDPKKIILLTADGVGREINFSYSSIINEEVEVYIHHHITESDQSLWGFKTLDEKKLFETLKSVNKVGSSKAYPIVTQVGIDNTIAAIKFDQPDVLSKAQGIGKKMAEQIILSLKDKIDKVEFSGVGQLSHLSEPGSPKISSNASNTVISEALQALETLGYTDKSVLKIVRENYTESMSSSEDLLKSVLKQL